MLKHLRAFKGHPNLMRNILSRVDLRERPELVKYLRGVKLPKRLEEQVLELAIRGDKEALNLVKGMPEITLRHPELIYKLPPELIARLPNKLEVLALIKDERLLNFVDDIASGLAEGNSYAAEAFLNLSQVSPEAAYKIIPVLKHVKLNKKLREAIVNLAKAGYDVRDLALKDERLSKDVIPYLDLGTLVEATSASVSQTGSSLEPLSLGKLILELPSISMKKAEGSYGNYVIIGLIGEGGYSRVYMAKHRYLDFKVALKVFKASRAFSVELESLRRLKHEHILAILDAGVQHGEQYLALELGKGSLADYKGKLSDEQASYLLASLASALSYAHSHGVAHGDVKPSNVILVQSQNGYVPKLADFSIARLLDPELTRSMSNVKGSSGFLDPNLVMKAEQGEELTDEDYFKADVYSLGVTVSLYLRPNSRLLNLITRMASPMPELRPSLEEVLAEL